MVSRQPDASDPGPRSLAPVAQRPDPGAWRLGPKAQRLSNVLFWAPVGISGVVKENLPGPPATKESVDTQIVQA